MWFDEYSLKVGDNLRESIGKGIKECRRCILVVTPNFLSNTGWTRTEFESVFTREILERSNVVLPVWHGVDVKEVYKYSPSLANKKAVIWEVGIEEVARQLHRVLAIEE